ncbi:MAG: hypothetical protein SFW35_11120 [Chitinophagales bacterium]|nr:hypothetical protein [Chitinophagales bacterium]
MMKLRERRKLRRERISKLAALSGQFNFKEIKSHEDLIRHFAHLWPFLKMALELMKTITRERGDRVIEEITSIGERIAAGNAGNQDQTRLSLLFEKVWSWLRFALNMIATISTNSKVDAVIDDIIAMGDLICKYQPAEDEL